MKVKTISLSLIAAGLFVAGMPQSYASDGKRYPGSMCVRWNGNMPAPYLNASRLFNPSTSKNVFLDCPAVKDSPGSVRNSWIRVIDQNPNEKICANFTAYRQIGASVWVKGTRYRCTSVSGASAGAVTLNTGAISGSIPTDAHYYFSVQSLPKRYNGRDSGVVTHYVSEN